MQRQGSFAEAEYAGKEKQTRRDKFLAEMEAVMPWARLVERLRPLYPKGERGWPPIPLERMLRVYFVQQWYGLADAAVADALGARRQCLSLKSDGTCHSGTAPTGPRCAWPADRLRAAPGSYEYQLIQGISLPVFLASGFAALRQAQQRPRSGMAGQNSN
jgi:hypothetical protein